MGVMLHGAPKQPRGSAASSAHLAQLGRLAVRAEWRRGVGRQARQSGGRIALFYKAFLKTCIFKRVLTGKPNVDAPNCCI